MNQSHQKTNDETRERFVWRNLIQPIIEAYGIKGLKYQYTLCIYDLADDIKMERLVAQMPNGRPFNSFNELFLNWKNGVQGIGEFSYKNYFIELMNYLKEEGTLPYFLRFIDENYLTDEHPNKCNPKRKPERPVKWISFDDLMKRWDLTRFELMQMICYYIDNKDKALPVYYHHTGLTYMDDVEPNLLPIQDWSVQVDTLPERMVFYIEDIERLDSEYISAGGTELADYAIKEIIPDALADGFIGELQLAEVLAADPQYKKILPGLWQKFQLYIRDTKEPDMTTFGNRAQVWNKLLLRWTTGTIQGVPGGREYKLLNTFRPGAIELQTLKDFFERWEIPLPSSLFSSMDKNSYLPEKGEEIPKKQLRKRFSTEMIPIETSEGLEWSGVTITFIDKEEILVQYAGESSSRKFQRAGFEDGRSGKPIASWAVLRESARNGVIPFTFDNRKRVEKTVQTLNNKLSELFPHLPPRPIKLNKCKRKYRFAFKIKSTIT